MAIGADVRVDIKVIEEHKLAGQLVMIGRDVFPEQEKRGIAVAFFHIAQYLIVGAVLLHDINDMLDRGKRVSRIELGVRVRRIGKDGFGPGSQLFVGVGIDP